MSPVASLSSRTPLLRLPVRAAVCRVALGFLDRATEAHTRLIDGTDPEALHDLRVALRRLRSLFRAYRPWLGELPPRKRRRQLRRLARSTNEARDSEVQLDWLKRQRIPLDEKIGVQWLAGHLAKRRDQAYRHIHKSVSVEFLKVEKALRAILVGGATIPVMKSRPAHAEVFGPVTGELLAGHATALRNAMTKIRSLDQESEIHSARIAAKRLRYLIEPVIAHVPSGKSLVATLKKLQDKFGVLNDSFVRRRLLLDAVREAGADAVSRQPDRLAGGQDMAGISRIDPLPGLMRLAKVTQRDIQRQYAGMARHYPGHGAPTEQLFEAIARFSITLKRSGGRVAAIPRSSPPAPGGVRHNNNEGPGRP